MKIAVMGAGAVGCYYGGMLARAGHDVVLVARPAHVEAMQRQGLRLDTQTFQEQVRVQASTQPEAVQGAQCVLFCVKSTDTESAGLAMAPHLAEGATVLSLQNGVDNAERLAAVLQRPVLPAVVYVATAMAGPGHVRHFGRGELVVAPSPASEPLAQTFAAAGIPVQVSDNVAGALWAKLVLNCVYNPLSAITGLPYGEIVNSPGLNIPRMMDDIVQECLAVARASGIHVPEGTAEAVLPLAASMPGQISSTAQDLARAKHSEIDHLNGFIVRRGEALGIATPANRLLHILVRLLEKRLPAPPSA
ncbi:MULTISPECIES: ketopantoate reductase family protein [unclassified Simplicispira]|uniref:ketopantoate reductase family protein n=1 Tax=unclassified Simplicispira TaxID=2630407 RepID=UPI000D5D1AAF|nr:MULTISPECIES: 2-dehydropantoate 2-reductase [unclassified Simplicispira]MBH1978245.1 2-dehydropantoate 2-reductase [Comamonadaceae bacterium]PVY56335.1 ketopantoate reductase [Simplicispira sp. 125]REG17280.1 ketopantoate reductase [Simplicispira sp. 110]